MTLLKRYFRRMSNIKKQTLVDIDFSKFSASITFSRLPEMRTKYLLLYFYPKDETPGCTKEACNFRDSYDYFRKFDVEIAGVSMDDSISHEKFAENYSLPFPLLADPKGELIDLFDIWEDDHKERFFRSTFLLDRQGEIIQRWLKVDPEHHNQEVIKYLKDLH